MFSENELTAATNDPGLSPQEKSQIAEWIKKPEVAKQLSGAAGAALALAIGKYMKLGRTAKFLLGVAGYGAGRLLYNFLSTKQQHRQFAPYNDTLKAYEMDSKRY